MNNHLSNRQVLYGPAVPLFNFNPNHDPSNGQFTFGDGIGSDNGRFTATGGISGAITEQLKPTFLLRIEAKEKVTEMISRNSTL